MEVSDPISEYPDYEDLISDQWWETVEEGETSCPTSLVFSDASEKAHSQHSGFSDRKYEEGKLKTTKQWRQRNSPSAKKEDLTSSLVFGDTLEKAQHSAPVPVVSPKRAPVPAASPKRAPVPAASPKGAPVPAACPKGAPVPAASPKRAPVPAASPKRAPVPAASPKGAPVPAACPKGAPVPAASPKGAPVPAACPKGAPVPIGSQKRGKLRIPEYLTHHLKNAALETPTPIQLLQRAPVVSSKVLTCSSHGAPMPDKISKRRNPKNPELLRQHLQNAPVLVSSANLRIPKQQRQKNIQKGVSVPAKIPQRTLAPPCSPQQPPSCYQIDYLCSIFAKCCLISNI
ncbi:hypothetical protein PO909_019580 [Leuciscus waleckii]